IESREVAMAEQDSAPEVDLDQVVLIVSSYVQHHQIAPDQLLTLIVNVHRALAGLGRSPPVQGLLTPAVPLRRSVQQDYVIALSADIARKASADICAPLMSSTSLVTARAGTCR